MPIDRLLPPLAGLVIAALLVPPQQAPAPVEKLGPTTYRVARMRVDTARREVVVPGTINPAEILEFLASTKDGMKAYESAMSLDTDAISFNATMLLIGLDPSRSRPAMRQFDQTPPQGDPVEIEIAWQAGATTQRVKAEDLIFDQRAKQTLRTNPWVYTGSTFYDDGAGRRYLAETDGVLIGFMHGPQAIIDHPLNDLISGYGSVVLNPQLQLKPGTAVTVTIRALPVDRKQP